MQFRRVSRPFRPLVSSIAVSGILTLLLCPAGAMSQTASSISNLAGAEKSKAEENAQRDVAANNPWIAGAQLGYKFAGQGDFSDNLFVAGTALYKLPLDSGPARNWNLSILSNVAALAADAASGKTPEDSLEAAGNALLSSAQGIFVRLAPYRVMHAGTNARVTLFGGMGGKVNSLAAKDTSLGKLQLVQGRLSAGLELAVGKTSAGDPDTRPLTISVSGISSLFSAATFEKIFGQRKSSLNSIELTAIVPVQTGAGVLVESVLARGFRPAIRMGLLVVKK